MARIRGAARAGAMFVLVLIAPLVGCGGAEERGQAAGDSGEAQVPAPGHAPDADPAVTPAPTGAAGAGVEGAPEPVEPGEMGEREGDSGPEPGAPVVESGDAPCADLAAVAPGDYTLGLEYGGDARSALLHVPERADPATPAPLVISFHGFGSSSTQQAAVSGMSSLADERGFFALYPAGLNAAWNGGTCCPGAAADDVGFVRELVRTVSAEHCIDARRIHVTGISNGGLFANRMACEAADLIASAAPIAGGVGVACAPERPVAHLTFSGSADPLVPLFVQQAEAATWRDVNGCSEESSVVYEEGDARCEEWSGCDDGASVRLCVIDGGGHTWPGGMPIPLGKTSTDIDASREMVTFFEGHPMP